MHNKILIIHQEQKDSGEMLNNQNEVDTCPTLMPTDSPQIVYRL